MRYPKSTFCRITVLLLALLTACNSQSNNKAPNIAPSQSNTDSQNIQLTLMPQIPPTLPATPLPATTDIPTMSVDGQLQLYDLFKNNNGCELPCFLGIMPGETSWQDAQPFLEELTPKKPIAPDIVASTSTIRVYITTILTNHDVSLHGDIQANVDTDNVVQQIIFWVEITRDHKTETRDKHLTWYSLSGILKRYGSPDAIYLYYTNDSLGYSLDIVYAEKKFIIEYGGEANLDANGNLIVCPNLGDGNVSNIKLVVANPSDPIDIKTLMGYPFWDGTTQIEEATQMSMDDFYHLMTSNQQSACFGIQKLP